jgi:hypothetical protein
VEFKKQKIMCEAGLITRKVVRLSRRSFNHRIEVASPNGYHYSQLARLNRELGSLYEAIYDDWTTITEDDYKVFGGQLQLLILTIKQLYDACRRLPKENGLKEETRKLSMNYSALYELNSDIVNFRIKLPKNEEMKQTLRKLADLDKHNS